MNVLYFSTIRWKFFTALLAVLFISLTGYSQCAVPAPVVSGNIFVCTGGVTTLSASSSFGTYEWFDAPSGGTLLQTGTTYNTPPISVPTTYYVQASSSCIENPLSVLLANINTNAASISASVPTPFNFNLDAGLNGTNINDGGSDMYDGGNYLNTNLGTNIPYSDNAITSSTAFGAGTQYFTYKINNMFIMVADINNISTFSITGNNGADGSGTADGTTFTVTLGCITYSVFLKRIYGAGDPSINQMIIIPQNAGVTQTFSTDTDLSQHDITGLNATTRIYYLLYAGNAGAFIDNAAAQTIATDFLTLALANTGGTCTSARTAVTVSPITNPGYTGSTIVCNPGSTTLTATGTGTSFNWFDAPTGGTLLATTASYTTPLISTPTTYYVESTLGLACVENNLGSILTNINTNQTSISSSVPTAYDFNMDGPGGVNSTHITDGGADLYDGGNYLNTNLGTNISYSDNAIISSPAFGAGGQYFTRKINNMFIMVADVNNVSTFSITGNNGADGAGNVDGYTFNVNVGCTTYNVFLKRIYGAGDPSINQMIIIPQNPSANHTYATSTDNTQHDVLGLASTTRIYYLLYAGTGGAMINNASAQTIATNFLTQINSNTVGTTCSSGRTPVFVDIISNPTVTGNTSVCNPGSTSLTANSNTGHYQWFDAPSGGTLLDTNATFTTPSLSSSTTYYVESTLGSNCIQNTLATILSSINTNATSLSAIIPTPYNFNLDGPGALNSTHIIDGGADMFDGGNYLNTNLGTSISYSDNVITTSPAFGSGGQYFTRKINNMFIMVADVNNISTFFITGNNGADGAGNVDGPVFNVNVGCITYNVFLKRVYNAGDPSINQMVIIPQNPSANQAYSANTDITQHDITGLNATTRIYYLLYAGTGGAFINNTSAQTIATDFLIQINANTGSGASCTSGRTPVTVNVLPTPGWNGSVSTDWDNPVNWCGAIPTTTTDAIIPDAALTLFDPTVNITTAVCRDLNLQNGSYINIAPGQTLTVYRDWNNNTGNIANVNADNISTVVMNNAAGQITGNTSTIFGNFTNNSTGYIDVNIEATVKNNLNMNGNFWLNQRLILGTSPTTTGTLNYTPVSGWIAGPSYFRRYFNATTNTGNTGLFPLGAPTSIYYRGANIEYTTPPASGGWIESRFVETSLTLYNGLPIFNDAGVDINNYMNEGYWEMIPGGGLTGGNYSLTLRRDGIATVTTPNNLRIIKSPGPGHTIWVADGSHGTVTGNTVSRTGMAGFSWFVISSDNTNPLPVELIDFTATCIDEKITFKWSTASETNNSHFIIEKSNDFINWLEIRRTNGAGNINIIQNYEVDYIPASSEFTYYRLKQIDFNGDSEVFNPVYISCDLSNSFITIYPNPTEGDFILEVNPGTYQGDADIFVSDQLGRLVYQRRIQIHSGTNLIQFSNQELYPGTYFISLTGNGYHPSVEKLIIK